MISFLNLNICHSCLNKFGSSSLNYLSYSFLSLHFWVRVLLNHLFILIIFLLSTHVSIFEKVLFWKFRSSLNRPWSRITFSIWLFPILFYQFDSLIILIQFVKISFPSFKHLQFIVHIMRVDIIIKWERMRYFHLHSFVCNYPVIDIKWTFLSLCNDWIYLDILLFARPGVNT